MSNTYKKIGTFVFFDLETTDFIRYNAMPRITELSMVAVSRDSMCENQTELPRIMHKLTLPIDPIVDISRGSQAVTRLSNDKLKDSKPFDKKTFHLIEAFILQLQEPICFVAYNGNVFDYPIFLWQIRNINMTIGKDILSVDMLLFMKEQFPRKSTKRRSTRANAEVECSDPELLEKCFNDGNNDALAKVLDSLTTKDLDPNAIINCNKNETNSALDSPVPSCYKKMKEINEEASNSAIVKSEVDPVQLHDTDDAPVRQSFNFKEVHPCNLKLSTVHECIVGSAPIDEHTAEADCLSMLRCVNRIGCDFIDWADRNAKPLVDFDNPKY